LPSAVRAFFRNGGRRCWVIRVAGQGATSNRFPLPGVFELKPQELVQAHARARSEGSWSDNIAVGAALRSQSIEVAGIAGMPDTVGLLLSSMDDVVPGDLLKFSLGNSSGVLWFFVDSVTPVTQPSPPPGGKRGFTVTVQGKKSFWQSPDSPLSSGTSALCDRLAAGGLGNNTTPSWSLAYLGFSSASAFITSPLSAVTAIF